MSIDSAASLDVREQVVRIEKVAAEAKKISLETRLLIPQMVFQASLASAALIGAVVAAIKLFV